MDKRVSLSLKLELTWWLVTAILVFGLLYPIYKLRPEFPFWVPNFTYIVVFVTFARYIFLLRHTFLGYAQKAKVAVLFLCLPLAFYLITSLYHFQTYSNEFGLEDLFDDLSLEGQTAIVRYVRSEMLFFGVASILTTIAMPFRMLVSYWRMHNHGTV